ncbi:MAG: TonB-dependent siderophore receptor [Burkholderiaceae bacterium]
MPYHRLPPCQAPFTAMPPATRAWPLLHPVAAAARSTLLACAVAGSLLAAATSPVQAQAQGPAQTAGQRTYRIPAGSLDQVLNRFASESGVELSVDSALTQGKNSAGLSGRYTVDEGFARLVEGQGLQAVRGANGAYSLRVATAPAADARERASTSLPAVTVTAESADARTEGTHSYTTKNVTLGKSETAWMDIPQSVSVITRQRMDDQDMTRIVDVMRQATGVTTRINDNPYLNNAYYARGYELSSELDGVPSSGSLNVGAPQFDLAMYDRIEIIRGSASLLEGSGEPGGLINFARKRPTAQSQASASVSAGSWSNYHADLDVSGPMNADRSLRGRAVAAVTDRNRFYGGSKSKSQMLYGIVEYDVAPATLLSISATVQHDTLDGIMSRLPTYGDGRQIDISRKTNPFPSWTGTRQNTAEGFVELNHYLDNDWRLRASLRYRRSTNDARYLGIWDDVDPDTGSANYFPAADDTRFSWAAADINASGPFRLLGRQHHLLVGMNYDRTNSTDIYSDVPAGTADFFELVHMPQPAMPFAGNYKNRSEQFGVYGQARLQITDPLTLIIGGRLTNYKSYSGLADYGSSPEMEKSPGAVSHKFTPYGGLVYKLTAETSLYASYSRIFVPQSQLSATGSPLPARTGRQVELGIKSRLMDGKLNTSAAVFNLNDNNRAYYFSDVFYYKPAGEVKMSGFEAEASGRILPGWDVTAGYTYLHASYATDQDNLGLYTPKHNLKIWNNYRFQPGSALENVNLGLGLLGYSAVGNGKTSVPGYVTASLQVGYRLTPKTSLSLTVNNILDKTYYQSVGYFGEPRAVMLTLRSRL